MREAKQAAMYVRMSTEHQQYSITSQADAIQRYAADHKLTIVKRFEDSGKSGLTLAGRPALRQLLLEVISMRADFAHVLVYERQPMGTLPRRRLGSILRVHVQESEHQPALLC